MSTEAETTEDLTGTIQAAEIAAGDEDLDTTEAALLEALGECRRLQNSDVDVGGDTDGV